MLKILVLMFVISCLQVHISLDTPFEVLYFRWSYVHAHNKSGPVKCVSWIPRVSFIIVGFNMFPPRSI
jgi:hypothetical protein